MILYNGLKTSPGNINHGATCPECGLRIEWIANRIDVNGLGTYGICRACEIKFLVVPTEVFISERRGWEEPEREENKTETEDTSDIRTDTLPLEAVAKLLGTTITTSGKYTTENGRPEVKCEGAGRCTFFGLKDGDEVDGWLEYDDGDNGYSQSFKGKLSILYDANDTPYAMVRGSMSNGRKEMLFQDGDEIQVHRKM